MGMENLPGHDNGTQAYLAFGSHEGGTWLLPRGYTDTSKPNPVAARGDAGGQRGAAGNRGNNAAATRRRIRPSRR